MKILLLPTFKNESSQMIVYCDIQHIIKIIVHSLNLHQDNKDNKMLRLIISLTLLSLSLANIVKRSEYNLFSPIHITIDYIAWR